MSQTFLSGMLVKTASGPPPRITITDYSEEKIQKRPPYTLGQGVAFELREQIVREGIIKCES